MSAKSNVGDAYFSAKFMTFDMLIQPHISECVESYFKKFLQENINDSVAKAMVKFVYSVYTFSLYIHERLDFKS